MRAVHLFFCWLVLVRAETLYEVLGVESTASAKEIRTAYRKLALQLHPDKKPASGLEANWADTTERFIKVSEAYATLSNDSKRAEYDASQSWRWHRSSSSSGNSGSSSSSSSSSGGPSGPGGGTPEFAFSFSLADAFDVLERFLRSQPVLQPLADSYLIAKSTLETWPGFTMPLPELVASGTLLKGAIDAVDWSAVAGYAKRALAKNFEHEDGSVNWGKVAAVAGAGVTAVAAALDSADDGNRTRTLFSWGQWGGHLLGALRKAAGDGTNRGGERPNADPFADELR